MEMIPQNVLFSFYVYIYRRHVLQCKSAYRVINGDCGVRWPCTSFIVSSHDLFYYMENERDGEMKKKQKDVNVNKIGWKKNRVKVTRISVIYYLYSRINTYLPELCYKLLL